MKILCLFLSFWERWHIKRAGWAHLPPASLRYRVQVRPDMDSFLKNGKKYSRDIEDALMKIGKNGNSFEHILDFGCGCGRTLIGFSKFSSSHFYGTDIDVDAISWCQSNLGFGNFYANKPLPPLNYPSEMFDLIYALSVFTHLDEDSQFRWLRELKRIMKPKGILLLTVYGRHCWNVLPRQSVADVERRGFLFIPITSNTIKGIPPSLYQNAYHTKEYVLERYSQYFNILDYIEKGLDNCQDIIILQKASLKNSTRG